MVNEVEAHMEPMRPEGKPPDHATMETLLWVWDHHDRIKGAQDPIVDIKEATNLINALLLPLLALLWANREAILELSGWAQ